jgi:cephalosporin-C deacetylase
MRSKHSIRFIIAFLCIGFAGICQAQFQPNRNLEITTDHADGVYHVGDTVKWKVEWKGTQPAPTTLPYSIKKGQIVEVKSGTLALENNVAMIETTLDEPGTQLAIVTGPTPPPSTQPAPQGRRGGGRGAPRWLAGVVADPDKIKPSAPRPDDFDQFWADKVKELEAVPANPQLTSVDSGNLNVDYWKITMDNIRGTHIQGEIAKPKVGEKFPALLLVQYAGVYGLSKNWVTDRASDGWLALDIEAHDIEIDQPQSYYQQQSSGPIRNYWAIGNDDRETSYFLRMYLSCYRAAEYLSQRPDWNGKVLVVMGGSQGGQQSLMTAGFFPGITAALAAVPAGSDMLGPDVGRLGGWPQWYKEVNGKDPKKVHEASRYFDVTNFASRIKCPVLVGLGLIDETVPAAGVFATLNQISSPKEIIILPHGDHHGTDPGTSAYGVRQWKAWLPALKDGKEPPVNQN